jgi:uncharacterized protein YbjT (DUF2867 family)
MTKKILILGGTGLLGEPVAHRLNDDGFQVRIMARGVEKARQMFDESFEIVAGDVANIDDVNRALEGCSGAHISVGGDVDYIGTKNVVDAANGKGLERLTYLSGSTVFEQNRWFPMVNQKLRAEESIRESGIPYTIFCPTWPMEQLPRLARAERVAMIGSQPIPVHWFAADDLARMVSTAYRLDEAANKRFFVHGPEAIRMKDALLRYCAVFRPDVESVSIMPIWLAKLMGALTGNEMLKFGAALLGYFHKVGELGDAAEANQILGAPTITLEEWLEKRKLAR